MTYLYPFYLIFFAVFSQSAGDRTEADNEASGKWQLAPRQGNYEKFI